MNQESFFASWASVVDQMTFQADRFAAQERAFYLIDGHQIVQKYREWRQYLPQVKPFYAIKCNPDPKILSLLQVLGAGFDCASPSEIDLALAAGAQTQELIYANPCKQPNAIAYAAQKGVHFYTLDAVEELEKIVRIDPLAQLVLRIKTDDSHSMCRFSTKFGADLSQASAICQRAAALGAQLVGVSFHAGSGCASVQTYEKAIQDARSVFDYASSCGMRMHYLDIGGGFPAVDTEQVSFPILAQAIQSALHHFFPAADFPDLQVIGETARYMVGSSHTLYLQVIARKEQMDQGKKKFIYYLNDGVYGSFNCMFFDHYQPQLSPCRPIENAVTFPSTFFGPTCDSLDKLLEDVPFVELQLGDWLKVNCFGAYTRAAASTFNGFEFPDCYYHWVNI